MLITPPFASKYFSFRRKTFFLPNNKYFEANGFTKLVRKGRNKIQGRHLVHLPLSYITLSLVIVTLAEPFSESNLYLQTFNESILFSYVGQINLSKWFNAGWPMTSRKKRTKEMNWKLILRNIFLLRNWKRKLAFCIGR